MNIYKKIAVFSLIAFLPLALYAQKNVTGEENSQDNARQKVVIVTGVRFSYELVEKWIDEYSRVKPGVQIVVESRGSSDPTKYDILVEVKTKEDIKGAREYLYIGRYAVLPVANNASAFAAHFSDKGFNEDTFKEVFFHDIFSGKGKHKPIDVPYTVYTRLQKAGVPAVFAKYFGYEQKDIKGTGIAGADSHLLKALLRDSTGVSYLPLSLIYDKETRKPITGISVLPVDINGNKKVTDDEKFYDNLDTVIEQLEHGKELKNIPIEYLHLSIDKQNATAEAIDFLKWVRENGAKDLHHFGYLVPENDRLREFASRGNAGK